MALELRKSFILKFQYFERLKFSDGYILGPFAIRNNSRPKSFSSNVVRLYIIFKSALHCE